MHVVIFDKFFLTIVYMGSLFFFFNFSSFFVFWFWLEFNIIIFLIFVVAEKINLNELNSFSQCLYYFILQSRASIFFLILFTNENFYFKDLFLLLIVLFKLGAVPFHFWIYQICEYLNFFRLFIILNFQKVPLIFLVFSYNFNLIFIFLVFNMLVGCYFLFSSNKLINFLVRSRICFINWIIFIFFWRMVGFFIFLIKYFIFNYVFLSLKKFIFYYEYGLFFFFKLFFLRLFLVGFPPMSFFYFKFYLINFLMANRNIIVILLIWFFSFLCLLSYFNFFFFNFFKLLNYYNTKNFIFFFDAVYLVFFLFSFIFFV